MKPNIQGGMFWYDIYVSSDVICYSMAVHKTANE